MNHIGLAKNNLSQLLVQGPLLAHGSSNIRPVTHVNNIELYFSIVKDIGLFKKIYLYLLWTQLYYSVSIKQLLF